MKRFPQFNLATILSLKFESEDVMKLLTHNMLTSKAIKGVQTGFPLKIVVSDAALQVAVLWL